jgi:hypothetical protein
LQINKQIADDPKRMQDVDRFYLHFNGDEILGISKSASELIKDISDTISFSYYDESRIGSSIRHAINELAEINDVFRDFGSTTHCIVVTLENTLTEHRSKNHAG